MITTLQTTTLILALIISYQAKDITYNQLSNGILRLTDYNFEIEGDILRNVFDYSINDITWATLESNITNLLN